MMTDINRYAAPSKRFRPYTLLYQFPKSQRRD